MIQPKYILPAIFFLLTGVCPLPAQDAPAAPQTVAAAVAEHPFYDGGFYPAWSKMSIKAGMADIRSAMAIARADLAKIAAVEPGEETYENVFAALEKAGQELENTITLLGHLAQVKDSPSIRKAQEACIPILAGFSGELLNNARLWQVIKRAAAQPWVKELSPAKQRFVQQTLDTFREEGADLPPEQKARKLELMMEAARLRMQYDQNTMDAIYAWRLVIKDPAQLAGMPEEWMQKAAALARGLGLATNGEPCWCVTLDSESAGAITRFCTVEATRKACWEGLHSVGKGDKFDNEAIVARTMELRQELATLAGCKNYADKACLHRMVDTGDKAMAFVDDMMLKVKPAFQKENQELLDYISARKGEVQTALAPWDRRFYESRLMEERHNFDEDSVRPYFRSDNVLRAVFAVYSRLYGITITEERSVYLKRGDSCPEGAVEVWHPTVKVFKVTDNQTGAHLGSFYFDPYPRAGKQGSAWVASLRMGQPGRDGKPHEPHLAVLSADLPVPGKEGYSLLRQRDVTTLFHEFGHMMHAMLSDTEIFAHGGTEVALDFAELPSQINENWAWEPEIIALYGYHHETGEKIPDELVQKLVASRYFRPASEDMGQLALAKLDLELHMHYAEKFAGKPLDEATAEILIPWQIPMTAQPPSVVRNFSHCISAGDYAAGYFSYKWSEVLSADAFSRFKKEGLLNPETGAAFRNCILKQGDSKPAEQLYRDFMGRDPNPDILLERYKATGR